MSIGREKGRYITRNNWAEIFPINAAKFRFHRAIVLITTNFVAKMDSWTLATRLKVQHLKTATTAESWRG